MKPRKETYLIFVFLSNVGAFLPMSSTFYILAQSETHIITKTLGQEMLDSP